MWWAINEFTTWEYLSILEVSTSKALTFFVLVEIDYFENFLVNFEAFLYDSENSFKANYKKE